MSSYSLPQGINIKCFSDGTVVYDDTSGDTHKLDTATGCILNYIEATPATFNCLQKHMESELPEVSSDQIVDFLDKSLKLLLDNKIIIEVD